MSGFLQESFRSFEKQKIPFKVSEARGGGYSGSQISLWMLMKGALSE